ncbi:hypothetical protein HMPREF1544_04633 [Mucor circinelloides 1006PhL]|uniref:DUF7275 domain-containing protein n=1 Tax=Mucor circinelloides f. circinelloides (strain 1006PhL) TaxID=1220926 RepID=S2K8D8_MUCC1|nr:hypothetical protein HMPREF1544_04633 [Mucor circinelloides 1006PhL]
MSFSRFLFTFNNDYRKKKRSNNKNPVKNEGDKRARTDSTTNLIIKGEPSFVSSPTVSRCCLLALNLASAYRSALHSICTTLTKGWFRQFAVDNFPRPAAYDRNLISNRDSILEKHSLPPVIKDDPHELLQKTMTDLDGANKLLIVGGDSGDANTDENYDSDEDVYEHLNREDELETDKGFWMIDSAISEKAGLLVAFYNECYFKGSDCISNCNFHGLLSVQSFATDVDIKHISAFKSPRYGSPDECLQKQCGLSIVEKGSGYAWCKRLGRRFVDGVSGSCHSTKASIKRGKSSLQQSQRLQESRDYPSIAC